MHRRCCFNKVGCLVCWCEVCSPNDGAEMDNTQMWFSISTDFRFNHPETRFIIWLVTNNGKQLNQRR